MANETPTDTGAKKSGAEDLSNWGGFDLPKNDEELDSLPTEEHQKNDKFLRIIFIFLVALLLLGILLVIFTDYDGGGLRIIIGVLTGFLVCGGAAILKRSR